MICICTLIHTIAIEYDITILTIIVEINTFQKLFLSTNVLHNRLKSAISEGINSHDNRYPPEGPMKLIAPPCPPVRTGRPTDTIAIKIATEIVPFLPPNNKPANIIPKFCRTIGTGIIATGIAGTNANAIINAVISAICVTSLVFISLSLLLTVFLYKVNNFIYYQLLTNMSKLSCQLNACKKDAIV
ncbi:hypothetical protein FD43_GL001095 [Apilactobacillus kunkeei DSM 12361 = ATCC 700308]|uniref:Uncharacterized protein n=1 Tax=Apilactobacillus kunkeei DSM 12361 = ATCC 700308 TaxID=1423768 RepID=A0A0R1FR86_9LACO|nr:hypothetical protein FD43_GL001095 [Apilactobacillus kunkeei DSM 12361 = ATCC 700308]